MISLNGIQIDEADLKRQLEAQGWACRELMPPKTGHVWTRFALLGSDKCMTDDYAGYTIPDELIRAYEALYQTDRFDAEYNGSHHRYMILPSQWESHCKAMNDVAAALKAQGEKR